MFAPDGRSTTEKGLGKAHRQTRAAWALLVEAGGVSCCRCGKPIVAGKVPQRWRGQIRLVDNWHLDHSADRRSYLGAAHASCNVKAGARAGGLKGNASPKRRGPRRSRRAFAALSTSRSW